MLLYIVRHGECYGNVNAKLHTGPDTELTERGRQQATCAGQRLAELGITHIVSSPLLRALATAQIIAEQAGIASFAVWMNLREGNHGEYWCEGRQRLATVAPKALLPDELGSDGWLHKTVNNQEFTLRCEQVVAELRKTFVHHDRVVVVTHGLVGSNLLHALLGISWQRPTWFQLDNCSITQIRLVPEPSAERPNWELLPPVNVEVAYVNDVRHLAGISKIDSQRIQNEI